MGFLLLQYEYQRATRKYNSCIATGIRLDNRVERCTNRISKIESIYDKAETKLESKYTKLTSSMSQVFQSVIGQLYSADNSSLGNVLNPLNNTWGHVTCYGVSVDASVSAGLAEGVDSSTRQAAIAKIMSEINSVLTVMKERLEAEQEFEQTKLDQQEEEQLEPIKTENTELEAQQACNETLTTMWQTRRDNAKDRLGDNIQSSVAGFGLK